MSLLSNYLSQDQFCVLFEYLTPSQSRFPVKAQLAGFPVCVTLADRVHSDNDAAPLEISKLYPENVEKLIHYSGKGRDIEDFVQFLHQAKSQGQGNLLLLTGDKLKNHQFGDDGAPRTRYLESINAVMEAKRHGGFYIGVALNPFKYTESEKEAQYLKLHKKIKAGADYVITQLGYDLSALQEAQDFLKRNQYSQKMLACVMPLTLERAQFILKKKVAGIVIHPHLVSVLKQEKKEGNESHVYKRCALQILICKHLGFSGVHLSACHKPEEQELLERYIEEYRNLDLPACMSLWNTLWKTQTGKEFIPPEVNNQAKPFPAKNILKYKYLSFIHGAFFESKVSKSIGKIVFKSLLWKAPLVSKFILKAELLAKHIAVACESCGQCRLADTLYVCPETCPKGLANGPCGGTHLDRCEFGDRECIHSVKVRLAETVNQTHVLKENLIPAVPIEVRGTSSWQNWFDADTKEFSKAP
ncbi:MAG: methylenetetrahydrofolate reductase C-terminal domain-containing protein [Cellvibrio sp.]|uniref:methylenetetrahydrofolate reductase C-terminal domain-containing protein n=1 Tax=Cellvibrio sp. TaxID=1965322 RepID=UPI0031B1F9EF